LSRLLRRGDIMGTALAVCLLAGGSMPAAAGVYVFYDTYNGSHFDQAYRTQSLGLQSSVDEPAEPGSLVLLGNTGARMLLIRWGISSVPSSEYILRATFRLQLQSGSPQMTYLRAFAGENDQWYADLAEATG